MTRKVELGRLILCRFGPVYRRAGEVDDFEVERCVQEKVSRFYAAADDPMAM